MFNALSSAKAEAQNFPFCTVEPNVGIVPVPDVRIDKLCKLYDPKSAVPASIRFVDIAGLVRVHPRARVWVTNSWRTSARLTR